MGRPKKEDKVKTTEEIEHEAKLKELERDVIRGLVQARKSQKLSQRVVGERAGVIRETVAKIENNLTIGYTLGVIPLEKEEENKEEVHE